MTLPGNTPVELAPYLAPGLEIHNTQALVAHMRRVLGGPGYEQVEPQWAGFVRDYLRSHSRQLRKFGAHTARIAGAIASQPSDRVVLRYFMLLSGELSI
jgi:hypothetical protein